MSTTCLRAGNVTYLDEAHKTVVEFTVEGPVRKLLFYDERSLLVTVTTTMMLTQHSVADDGSCVEMLKVKGIRGHGGRGGGKMKLCYPTQ